MFNNLDIKFKKIHSCAIIPKFQKEFDSGFDLVSVEDVEIEYGEITCVHTGLSIELPNQKNTYPFTLEMQIRCRSGLSARHGITVVNGVGTVDNGYRGELMVLLTTMKKDYIYQIKAGDRIAQGVIVSILSSNVLNIIEVDELNKTDYITTNFSRGADGLGSTGIN